MTIILKANKVDLFVSSVLFVFWYHSTNFLDTPRISYAEEDRNETKPPLWDRDDDNGDESPE
jgi:hypothetical protein